MLQDERNALPEWWQQYDFTSLLALPVLLNGSLLAVLALYGRRPFQLSGDEQDLLDSFVAQATVAIQNATLYADGEAGARQRPHDPLARRRRRTHNRAG